MQKQVLRPHGMTQVRLFPYVTVLIFGLIVWREHKPGVRLVITAFVGCMLGMTAHRNLFRRVYQQDITAPAKVAGAVDVLLHHNQEFQAANAKLYTRSHFVGFDVENLVVDNLAQVCGMRPEDDVYVLGDYPVFYMLLNRRPPYVSNMYNTSPIYEQQKVVDWFRRKKPRFVIWGTNPGMYDRVPHVVRLPLIYTYVVEHYEFVRAIGPFQILIERPADHAPDLEYWRRTLGDPIDLGHIPAQAKLSEYTDCGMDVSRCDAVLVVKYPRSGSVPGSKVAVRIDSSAGPFRVQFDVDPAKREYVVNLNRLWFWSPVAKSAAPRITAEDGSAQAIMQYRREPRPVLY
jgi:hypothetical protein